MTRDDAVARIQQILGFRTDLAVESEMALREAQEDVEAGALGFLPWFLRATYRLQLPSDTLEILLPLDFLREYDHEAYALWVTEIGPALRVEYFTPTGAGTIKDGSLCYWIDGDQIRLDRSFSSDVTVEYLYYRRDAVLDANIENRWLLAASQYLIGAAGLKMQGIVNASAASTFENMRIRGADALHRQDTSYRVGSKKPQFGGGTDRDYREGYNSAIRYNDIDIRE